MLIIIPNFNHYNWFFKVACSQISSLYVTRSWRVKVCVGKCQSSSKQTPELLCISCSDLTPCAHPESEHTAEVTALLCSSLGWMLAIITRKWHEAPRKLWGNRSLNKRKQSICRKKGWFWQGFTGAIHKESLGATHSLKASAVQMHSSLCSALYLWGCLQAHDSSASSSWSAACFYGAEMTETANTAPEQLQSIPFLSSINLSLLEGMGSTDTRCAQWNKGTVWFHTARLSGHI